VVGQGACPPHRETDRAPSPLAAPVFSHRIRRGLGRLEGRLLQAKPIVIGAENLEVSPFERSWFIERTAEGTICPTGTLADGEVLKEHCPSRQSSSSTQGTKRPPILFKIYVAENGTPPRVG
jgi:hypothetical protein